MVKILSYYDIYACNERSDKYNSGMINHDVNKFTSVFYNQQKKDLKVF